MGYIGTAPIPVLPPSIAVGLLKYGLMVLHNWMNLAALGEKNRGVDTEEVLAMWKLLPPFPSESDVRRVLERYQATHLGTEYTRICVPHDGVPAVLVLVVPLFGLCCDDLIIATL